VGDEAMEHRHPWRAIQFRVQPFVFLDDLGNLSVGRSPVVGDGRCRRGVVDHGVDSSPVFSAFPALPMVVDSADVAASGEVAGVMEAASTVSPPGAESRLDATAVAATGLRHTIVSSSFAISRNSRSSATRFRIASTAEENKISASLTGKYPAMSFSR
jgi:hypothetical protein